MKVIPKGAFFTVDERDAINHARARLRGCITILSQLLEGDDAWPLDADTSCRIDDRTRDDVEAYGVLLEDLRDGINTIDTTFEEADVRAGGAR